MTATYFLLAERLLSAQRAALATQLRQRRAARRSVTADAPVLVGSPSKGGGGGFGEAEMDESEEISQLTAAETRMLVQ